MNGFNESPTVSIGLCTDTHYWFNGPNFEFESLQLQGHSELLFESLLDDLQGANLDLCVHLGDMTSGGGSFKMPSDEFIKTRNRATLGLQGLDAETVALPGNHDCVLGQSWSHFEELWGLERGMGRTIDLAQARLVFLNAQGHTDEQIQAAVPADPVYGWISDAELERLEGELATAGDKPVLLFVHQLLRPWGANRPWKPYYGVLNSDKVDSLMQQYGNVRAVFQGHAHRYDVQHCNLLNHNGVTSSTDEECGADDSSNECLFVVLPALIEYPLGWLQIDCTVDTMEITLKQLPLEGLAIQSRDSMGDQSWRCGNKEWQTLHYLLTSSK